MKPDLISLLKQDTMISCDVQKNTSDKQSYEDRLTGVLSRTDSVALRYFLQNKITICLDKRLADEPLGTWEARPYGIFYPSDTKPVLALRDNGNHTEDHGVFESSVATYGVRSLERFPKSFGGVFDHFKSLGNVDQRMVARCGGKGCSIGWQAESTWGWSNQFDHPALDQPPLALRPAGPPSINL